MNHATCFHVGVRRLAKLIAVGGMQPSVHAVLAVRYAFKALKPFLSASESWNGSQGACDYSGQTAFHYNFTTASDIIDNINEKLDETFPASMFASDWGEKILSCIWSQAEEKIMSDYRIECHIGEPFSSGYPPLDKADDSYYAGVGLNAACSMVLENTFGSGDEGVCGFAF
jgi:hypothetical protein